MRLINPNPLLQDGRPSARDSLEMRLHIAELQAEVEAGGGSAAFADLTSGVNTTATMIVGSGATLTSTGTGVIDADTLDGQDSTDFAPVSHTHPETDIDDGTLLARLAEEETITGPWSVNGDSDLRFTFKRDSGDNTSSAAEFKSGHYIAGFPPPFVTADWLIYAKDGELYLDSILDPLDTGIAHSVRIGGGASSAKANLIVNGYIASDAGTLVQPIDENLLPPDGTYESFINDQSALALYAYRVMTITRTGTEPLTTQVTGIVQWHKCPTTHPTGVWGWYAFVDSANEPDVA